MTGTPIVISGIGRRSPELPVIGDEFRALDFETRRDLGKKGTRNLDRLTALAIDSMSEIVPALNGQVTDEAGRIGLVVGTAQGSMDSIVRFTQETLAYDRPDYINPALFPNTVMNCAAGQAAIWYGLKGPNATISCSELSALSAIKYAITLLRKESADTIIAGGVEEVSEVNEAANRAIARRRNTAPNFTEASVFFVLERADIAAAHGREILGSVAALETGFNPLDDDHGPFAALIARALETADLEPDDIDCISIAGSWDETRSLEMAAIDVCFENVPEIMDCFQSFGNGVSGHNALQLAQMLDRLEPGAHGLVMAHDRRGNMAAMVVTRGAA